NHHYNKNETQKSIDSAVFYAKISGDESAFNFAKTKQGIFYSQTNERQKAFKIYNELLERYGSTKNLDGQKYILTLISDQLLSDPESQKALSRLIRLKDSIFGLDVADKVASYQIKYESEKKENLNKILQQENMLNQAKINTRNRTIILLVISILLIVLLIFWRINVINLRKKQEELLNAQKLQQEKERISRDLHDNVGGQLSFVLLSLEGLSDEQKEKREEVVKSINESVRQVIGNLRETIWAISDENIRIQDFSDKLKVYSRNLLRHSNIQIKFQEQIESNREMNALVGLNLFRICQEIINNALKHSMANLLEVVIYSHSNITITISDNGKGFYEGNEKEGYGLSNIKKRAEETGIKVKVDSAPNKGVKYKLIV
ncbi:MAG: histidine kinase, partial [Bacteroidia bacterium]|nr:histidine kinase [Bacteroidia bacterium]